LRISIIIGESELNAGLYRGRLSKEKSEKTSRFLSSLEDDMRIFEEDIDGTEAHDIMLHEQGIISREDLTKILCTLERLRSQKRRGEIEIPTDFEDIHEFLEAYVIEEIGIEVGGKLHTGRSRNDQVATDIRMRVRKDLNIISENTIDLIKSILEVAEKHTDSLMILYTHTQHAQIGTFSHYLLAYAESLIRCLARFDDCYKRVNLSPLGAGPIGGSRFDVDRERTSSLLGFDSILENSIDAVSSRDFALETASVLALLITEMSRISEDLILWSSTEFGYLELADEYSSTSSVMPQKKNPCPLELLRGKTGHVYGALISLLTMMKGLSTGYNRDLQETKPPLWMIFDIVEDSLEILRGVILTLAVNKERMREVVSESYVIAVDLAEELVKRSKLSFREAHKLVGNLVREGTNSGISLKNVTSDLIERLSWEILGKRIKVSEEIIKSAIDLQECLEKRVTIGSPAAKMQRRMIKNNRRRLDRHRRLLEKRVKSIEESRSKLMDTVKKYIESIDSDKM